LAAARRNPVWPENPKAQTRNPNEARNPISKSAFRHSASATPSFRPTHRVRNRENA
jgi:nucleoid DNA-binding protein